MKDDKKASSFDAGYAFGRFDTMMALQFFINGAAEGEYFDEVPPSLREGFERLGLWSGCAEDLARLRFEKRVGKWFGDRLEEANEQEQT